MKKISLLCLLFVNILNISAMQWAAQCIPCNPMLQDCTHRINPNLHGNHVEASACQQQMDQDAAICAVVAYSCAVTCFLCCYLGKQNKRKIFKA